MRTRSICSPTGWSSPEAAEAAPSRDAGDLSFSENNGKTTVDIVGDSQVTGVVARVGQRLIGGATRMMMNQFFDCLRSKIEK